MTRIVEIVVHGTPRAQGSKRHVGNGVLVESGGEALRTWREDVKLATLAQMHGAFRDAVELHVIFSMQRPQSHFSSGQHSGELKPSAPRLHTKRPDVDKLLRSTFDALKAGGAYIDDSQVCQLSTTKQYADPGEIVGASIKIVDLSQHEARAAS